jgi:hemolysin activation/secretion protein
MALIRGIRRTRFAIAAGLAFLSVTGSGFAQVPPPGIDAQRRQDEQRQQTEERANERPNVLTDARAVRAIDLTSLPAETPCFPVHELHLLHNPFNWLDAQLQPVIGACIGKRAVQIIQEAVNSALIERGYITSRVLIPEQNLASGALNMEVIAGRVSAVQAAAAGHEIGCASFFVNASTSRYLQTVAGYSEPQQYRGDSAEVNAGMWERASTRMETYPLQRVTM